MTATKTESPLSAGRFWAAVPVLLLVSLIGTQLLVLREVLHDPSFSIEEDYYQQAVDWDARQEQDRQSRALGWTAPLEWTPVPGGVRLDLQLRDRAGHELTGALVSIKAFHNARAMHILSSDLSEPAPGHYTAVIPAHRPGLWEVRLEAHHAGQRFAQVVRRELSGARP